MTSSDGFSLHKECVKLKNSFILHSFLRFAILYQFSPQNHWFQNRKINDVQGCAEKFYRHCNDSCMCSYLPRPQSKLLLAFVVSMPRIWKQRILPKNTSKKILENCVFVGSLVSGARFFTSKNSLHIEELALTGEFPSKS